MADTTRRGFLGLIAGAAAKASGMPLPMPSVGMEAIVPAELMDMHTLEYMLASLGMIHAGVHTNGFIPADMPRTPACTADALLNAYESFEFFKTSRDSDLAISTSQLRLMLEQAPLQNTPPEHTSGFIAFDAVTKNLWNMIAKAAGVPQGSPARHLLAWMEERGLERITPQRYASLYYADWLAEFTDIFRRGYAKNPDTWLEGFFTLPDGMVSSGSFMSQDKQRSFMVEALMKMGVPQHARLMEKCRDWASFDWHAECETPEGISEKNVAITREYAFEPSLSCEDAGDMPVRAVLNAEMGSGGISGGKDIPLPVVQAGTEQRPERLEAASAGKSAGLIS